MPLITKDQLKIILQSLGKMINFKADKSELELKADKSELELKMNAKNPVGSGSFSMGRKPDTEIGINSHAEGSITTATGFSSHAEGAFTTASSNCSHAEGDNSKATGLTSHAEGNYTTASGDYSHAEGDNSKATGLTSHAEGYKTIASGKYQHTQGKYNIEDLFSKYAHIVGNGYSDFNGETLSNAHTLDWNGVGWFQGGLQVGGNAQDDGAKNVLLEGDAVLRSEIEAEDALEILMNMNLVAPVAAEDGSVYVDENGAMYSL